VGSGWLSQLIIPISAVVITCGLLGIAIYFTIKGLGHSFDHLFHKTEPVAPDPTDFESEAPSDWLGTFWVVLVSGLLATASIVLLYYLRDDPITETSVVLERDQSVLENIPDELRDNFEKDLKLFHKTQDSLWSNQRMRDTALPSVPKTMVHVGRGNTERFPGTSEGGPSEGD
jgi:hypothetical protein